MVIGDAIINKGYVVGVLPDTFPGNNIPVGTGWVKRVEKWNNRPTTMSVKLDIDGLLYHNIPPKYVTNLDILNILYSEPWNKKNVVTIL